MTLAYWCVLAAIFLPFVLAGMAKSERGFDNRQPRKWLAERGGWRLRANWAQQNQFEAFPPFAAGVIIAHLTAAPQGWVNALALAWLLLRVLYAALYVADRASARSLVWTAALLCVVGLFVVAGLA
jgi:uncharacterized MAPEG superfamily protein